MKKLLGKLVIFALVLLAIKLPFVYFYEDELAQQKKRAAARDFNAVLIGSSRTKYGVIPAYFDALTKNRTQTYNFGINAGLPPETFDWCEELIAAKPQLSYVFFELSSDEGLVQIPEEPWKSLRFENYRKALKKMSFAESLDFHERLAVASLKPNPPRKFSDYNVSLEAARQNGNILPPGKVSPEQLEKARHRNLQIKKDEKSAADELSENLWARVVKLINLAESKNIRLYFFVPPRLETDSEMRAVNALWQRLDEKYKLPVNHFEDALYVNETSVDDFHLNHRGALKFTENMAAAFSQIEK